MIDLVSEIILVAILVYTLRNIPDHVVLSKSVNTAKEKDGSCNYVSINSIQEQESQRRQKKGVRSMDTDVRTFDTSIKIMATKNIKS